MGSDITSNKWLDRIYNVVILSLPIGLMIGALLKNM